MIRKNRVRISRYLSLSAVNILAMLLGFSISTRSAHASTEDVRGTLSVTGGVPICDCTKAGSCGCIS